MEKERVERTDRRNRKSRKKVCAFCMDKIEHIDYKDVPRLRRYLVRPRKDHSAARNRYLRSSSETADRRCKARPSSGFPAIRRRLIDHTKARNCPVSGLFISSPKEESPHAAIPSPD